MKCITYLDRSLLLDDQTADALLHYASLLTADNPADDVKVNALTFEGAAVRVSLLLGAATPIMSETMNSPFPEPQNAEALAYLTERMNRMSSPPPSGLPDDSHAPVYFDDLEDLDQRI